MPYRTIHLFLGGGMWLVALLLLVLSIQTVLARIGREVRPIRVELPDQAKLSNGDPVYLNTTWGLRQIGEVSQSRRGSATLAINPQALGELNEGLTATYWRTPLSAEATVDGLLPFAIRAKIACLIAHDWQSKEEELARLWQPLVADLAMAYLEILTEEVESTWTANRSAMDAVVASHLKELSRQWPEVQRQLRPIFQEHLTPVLGKMVADAITEAPKVEIAMLMARGKHGEAFEHMFDWLVGYLGTISDEDRNRLNDAFVATWEAAKRDPALASSIDTVFRPLIEDPELRGLLSNMYRQAFADSPRTLEFFHERVLGDPQIRAQSYGFIEAFAPTTRTVLSLCIFDDQGTTRPEVVHLVRAVSLGRRVAWVTLTNPDPPMAPFASNRVLIATHGDAP